jgi:hypothetical protein
VTVASPVYTQGGRAYNYTQSRSYRGHRSYNTICFYPMLFLPIRTAADIHISFCEAFGIACCFFEGPGRHSDSIDRHCWSSSATANLMEGEQLPHSANGTSHMGDSGLFAAVP